MTPRRPTLSPLRVAAAASPQSPIIRRNRPHACAAAPAAPPHPLTRAHSRRCAGPEPRSLDVSRQPPPRRAPRYLPPSSTRLCYRAPPSSTWLCLRAPPSSTPAPLRPALTYPPPARADLTTRRARSAGQTGMAGGGGGGEEGEEVQVCLRGGGQAVGPDPVQHAQAPVHGLTHPLPRAPRPCRPLILMHKTGRAPQPSPRPCRPRQITPTHTHTHKSTPEDTPDTQDCPPTHTVTGLPYRSKPPREPAAPRRRGAPHPARPPSAGPHPVRQPSLPVPGAASAP